MVTGWLARPRCGLIRRAGDHVAPLSCETRRIVARLPQVPAADKPLKWKIVPLPSAHIAGA